MGSPLTRRLGLLFAAWWEEADSASCVGHAALERDHAARLPRSMPRSRAAKREVAHRLLRAAAEHRERARKLSEEARRDA